MCCATSTVYRSSTARRLVGVIGVGDVVRFVGHEVAEVIDVLRPCDVSSMIDPERCLWIVSADPAALVLTGDHFAVARDITICNTVDIQRVGDRSEFHLGLNCDSRCDVGSSSTRRGRTGCSTSEPMASTDRSAPDGR